MTVRMARSMKKPIPYGKEKRLAGLTLKARCHDCGVKLGEVHSQLCDVQECPQCGGQLIGCDCHETLSIHVSRPVATPV